MSVLKSRFYRSQPKEITHRDYKQFDTSIFKNELKNGFRKENIDGCTMFDEQFLKVSNSHAALKRKSLIANHAPILIFFGKP